MIFMKRHVNTKIAALDSRHPGLCDKLHGMFEEAWPMAQVRHMIAASYGESLSLRSLARYKKDHWEAQRELVRAMNAALAEFNPSDRIFDASDPGFVEPLDPAPGGRYVN